MESREKIVDKLVKIRRLAEMGIGGEKETAMKLYEDLKEKYSISDDETIEETLEKRWFGYSKDLEKDLLTQIFYKVTGDTVFYVYSGQHKRRKKVGCICTELEAAEITFLFEFYKRQLEEELSVFMIAFKQKNDLFPSKDARCYKEPEPDREKELSADEIRKYKKAASMRAGIDKKQPPRALLEDADDYCDLEGES